MEKKSKLKVVVPPERFVKMTSSEIVKFMEKDRSLAIVGGTPGKDRQIVKRKKY